MAFFTRPLCTLALCAFGTACTFSVPARPLDPPFIDTGTLTPGFSLNCKDVRDVDRFVRDDVPRPFGLTRPVDVLLEVPCVLPPIARPSEPLYPLTGTALDAHLGASTELLDHEPFVSMVQSVTFNTHTRRICGRNGYGSGADVLAHWEGTLRLPAAVGGRPFDVRVVADSATLLPLRPSADDRRIQCALAVGAVRFDAFEAGTHDVLRATAPGGTSVPIVLDCAQTPGLRSLNTLGCLGAGDDPLWISPIEKQQRLTLEFHVSPLR